MEIDMKKFLSLALTAVLFTMLMLVMFIPVLADANTIQADTAEERLGVGKGASSLDNKKILFAGCSYTYYGGMIEQTASSVTSQESRTENETGLFVRLAKLNGVKNLTVTDWVYGTHDLSDLFDGEACDSGSAACSGRTHLSDLTDRNYDIVILQDIITPSYTTPEEYVENLRTAMQVFLDVNPDTKFYLTVHHRYYQQENYKSLTESVQLAIEQLGIEVIDWGALIYDVTEGIATVPDSKIDYNYWSFVVSNNTSDGYHQNLLAGYLGTIMTYATLTGETAVDQPYEFIFNLTSKYLNIDKFISAHYKYDNPDTDYNESTTNMKEIFNSKTDMKGLQLLAEEYLTKTRWLDFSRYTVEFKDGDTTLSSEEYKWGDSIVIPETPTKPSDERYSYTFTGWGKEVSEVCRGNATYIAEYNKTPIEYTVTFMDDDGSILLEDTYEFGENVIPPSVSNKEDTDNIYIFKGWDKDIVACNGNATYTAVYEAVKQGYVVVFRDYDMTVISIASYKIGDTVLIPDAPERESDNSYNYSFKEWDKVVDTVCQGNAEYVAVYEKELIDYTVRFVDYDGRVIKEAVYHYGDTVEIPVSPSRPADKEYKYSFKTWSPEVSTVCEGDATYKAIYNKSHVVYTVLFLDDDGEAILTRTYRYGDTVKPPSKNPVKESDEEYTYVFTGWDKEITACEGNTSYTAVYRKVPINIEEEHVCEGVNGWHIFWNTIFNFFRRLFGMAETCPCGKTTL